MERELQFIAPVRLRGKVVHGFGRGQMEVFKDLDDGLVTSSSQCMILIIYCFLFSRCFSMGFGLY